MKSSKSDETRAKLCTLPINAVKPQGWLKRQMEQDLETGFAGHLKDKNLAGTGKARQ